MALARLAVDDVDLMEEVINTQPVDDGAGYEARYTQLESGTFRSDFAGTRRRDDRLLKDLKAPTGDDPDLRPGRAILVATRQRYGARVRVSGRSLETGTAYFLHCNPAKLVRCRGIELKPGLLIEIPPASELDFVTEGVSFFTFIPRNDIRDSIHRSAGHRPGPRTISLAPTSSARLATAISRYLESHRYGGGDAHLEQLLEEEFASCLAKANPDFGSRVTAERRRCAVRRAEAYLHEHPSRSVPTHELAEVAEIPLRTLQHGFREEFGVSPYAFHTHLRMQLVRRRLRQLTPESGRVGQLAMSYGFHHFGRFASDYRRLFGESPKETLRRRQLR